MNALGGAYLALVAFFGLALGLADILVAAALLRPLGRPARAACAFARAMSCSCRFACSSG